MGKRMLNREIVGETHASPNWARVRTPRHSVEKRNPVGWPSVPADSGGTSVLPGLCEGIHACKKRYSDGPREYSATVA